jgi:hypothetical protein
VDRVHESVDNEWHRSTVDHGHRPWGGLTGERLERRPRAWNLTAVEEKWRGDGGENHRLQERAVEGRTQMGDGGERSAKEVLGGVGAANSEARG